MCALNLKYTHPFIGGLKNYPENKKKDMLKIKAWMSVQSHLPEISEEFIYLFLHGCYYSIEKTKNCIEAWFTIRANNISIFGNRDPLERKMKIVQDIGYLIRLPKTTPEGFRVMLYGVRDPDPTKMNFNDVIKGFCMYNDCVLSEDGLQDGYVVIFDMKDVSIGHLARVSLPALKCFLYYIQDAHPCRIKAIHVLSTASWIQHVMRLVVPLVRSELLGLVKFHQGRIPDGIPLEILPMDYGGDAPTVEELDRSTKSLLGKYREWLIESGNFKADESKRIRKSGWWNFFSPNKSPQQVEIDEKSILKNLQID